MPMLRAQYSGGKENVKQLQADADRRRELLKDAPNPFGNFTGRYPVALEDWRNRYEDWYKQVKKELADA